MKCSCLKITIALFLMCLLYSNVLSSTLKLKSQVQFQNFNEHEAKALTEFSKNANCGNKPLTKTCMKCIHPGMGYKMFFFYQFTRLNRYNYKAFIHYNDSLKQVVVSFGAPSVENHKYIRMIYSQGFSILKLYRIKIEKEFKKVYYAKIRKFLLAKIHKLKQSGRANFRFVFTGYSLGGSLAVLAAYDLTKMKMISNAVNKTTVYTYGALRIGDKEFIEEVNKTITVWKIVRRDDFMVRIPNCFFSSVLGKWRCLTRRLIRKFIVSDRFPLRFYVKAYTPRGPLGQLGFRHGAHTRVNYRSFMEIKNTIKSHKQWRNPQIVPAESLVKTYYKYIFYTQPIGREIFYDPSMTRFTTCSYVRGVSNCERRLVVPRVFTSASHKTYFGVNFEHC